MKKILPVFLSLACSFGFFAVANATQENTSDDYVVPSISNTTHFSKFDLEGYKVRVIPSDHYSVKIVNNVKTVQSISEDGTLHLSVYGIEKNAPIRFFGKKKDHDSQIKDTIIIYTNKLDYLSVGYGNLELLGHKSFLSDSTKIYVKKASYARVELNSPNLRLYISGASEATAETKGRIFSANVNGASSLKSKNSSEYASYEAEGASKINLTTVCSDYVAFQGGGASKMNINAIAQRGLINFAGASKIDGDAKIKNKTSVYVSGASKVNIDLDSKQIDMDASSTSKINANIAADKLKASATSVSKIVLTGSTRLINTSTGSLGKIDTKNLHIGD